jgi:hypothetical protein
VGHTNHVTTSCRSNFMRAEIATVMHELENEKELLESDPDKLGIFFKEMIQMCLW